MGKGLVNLPDGVDFGAEHFGSEMSKNFGFTGSSEMENPPEAAVDSPTMGGHAPQNYAKGGNVHPHGHHVTHAEVTPHGTILHHKHGGFSHLHPDGNMTHHDEGGMEMPPSSGPSAINGGAGPGEGTFVAKQMASKAVGQHESHDHPGEPGTDLELARGGRSLKARIPGSMKPKGTANHSPINTAPRNPQRSVTRRNEMPGGELPYGVEPSSEPDVAGSEQGIKQLARGGRVGRDNC